MRADVRGIADRLVALDVEVPPGFDPPGDLRDAVAAGGVIGRGHLEPDVMGAADPGDPLVIRRHHDPVARQCLQAACMGLDDHREAADQSQRLPRQAA